MQAHVAQWSPIVSDATHAEVMAVVRIIADELSSRQPDRPDIARGALGAALFFAYLFRASADARWRAETDRWLRHALEADNHRFPLALLAGRTGTLWTARHIRDVVDTPGLDVMIDAQNDRIRAHLAQPEFADGYELTQGLVGYLRFALDGLDLASGRQLAAACVERLIALAVPMGAGVAWWTEYPNHPEDRHVRLGLAHGVPCAISILAEAAARGVETTSILPLLDQAVSWLLSKRNPEGSLSCFGSVVETERAASDPLTERLAWCWGDLGMSTALYGTGVRVGRPAWQYEALGIARHAARRTINDSDVIEAGICHGSSGAMHLFNRLYQATDEETMLAAARRWLDRTLHYAATRTSFEHEKSLGFDTTEKGAWPAGEGLLKGVGGVGLALLAATGGPDPAWDRFLLVSIPPRPASYEATAEITSRA